MAFASTLNNNEWSVSWIHMRTFEDPLLVHLSEHTRFTKEFNPLDISKILKKCGSEKKGILFLDGLVFGSGSGSHAHEIYRSCLRWLKEDRVTRRLVVVSSMTGRHKSKLKEDLQNQLEEFIVFSWSLEEYQKAVLHQSIASSVANVLDAHIEEVLDANVEEGARNSIANKVISKYRYAGGSSRFMFEYNTDKVINQIKTAVDNVADLLPYFEGHIGVTSDRVINRLFALMSTSPNEKTISFVSQYAAHCVGRRKTPQTIANCAALVQSDSNNPALLGWFLEMWVISKITHDGLNLVDTKGKETTWSKSKMQDVDAVSGKFPNLTSEAGVWLQPSRWNEGGYDLVFIKKNENLIRFVQITNGESHALKLHCFWNFLNALNKSDESFECKNLEIVFVVDRLKMESFKITPVIGARLLKPFEGWDKDEDKKCELYGISTLFL